jgi:hypothetical protein
VQSVVMEIYTHDKDKCTHNNTAYPFFMACLNFLFCTKNIIFSYIIDVYFVDVKCTAKYQQDVN